MSHGEFVKFGNNTVFVEHEDFYVFLDRKYSKMRNDLMRLGPGDRTKIFLRWKWGLESDKSNKDLQDTRNGILRNLTDEWIEESGGKRKDYWRKLLAWERHCQKISADIGLIGVIAVRPAKN